MKKIPIMIGLLFIFNILVKSLIINRVPNSVSFQEISILQFFKISPGIDDFSFRMVNVFIGSLISVIIFYFIAGKTKNLTLSLIVSLALSFSPWFFVLSGYLDYYLIPILFIVCLLVILPNNFYTLAGGAIALFLFRFFVVSHDLSSIKILSFVPDLIRLFDLRMLFFEGDPASPMLRVPLTGFFYYLDLLAIFSGLYYLINVNKNHELKIVINNILILGLVFFLILPSDLLFTQRGELVFLWMSIVIGSGYYHGFEIIKKKNRLLVFILILVLASNFLFTTELFINHFDKKNSSEWSYAEKKTTEYLMTKSDQMVFMTDQSDKLYQFWNFYKNNNKTLEVPITKMMKVCQNSKNICVVRQEELTYFNLSKDEITNKFGFFDGTPIYFILPSAK